MSEPAVDIDNDKFQKKSRRSQHWRQHVTGAYQRLRLRILRRDRKALVALVVVLIAFVAAVHWLFVSRGSGVSVSDNRAAASRRVRNYFDDSKKNYHDYVNSKLAGNHENIGFGLTARKAKKQKKTGLPPSPEIPGIFSEEELAVAPRQLTKARTSKGWFSKPKRKLYLILGHSPEVGIKHQKSKEYWLMEKLSVLNKKHYCEKHGYELIAVNSLADDVGLYQKRYQHEFRQGWEKFDVLRKLMKQTSSKEVSEYEEWFWYLDIHTLIMEPQLSLEEVIFKNLDYLHRDMKYFNPNNLVVDEDLSHYTVGSSLKETTDINSVDLILTQDCNGINLNSFLIKKSHWSNLLLDVIWDPVFYKQMHLRWVKNGNEKKYGFRLSTDEYDSNSYNNDVEEKNCLEYLFNTQSWIRSKVGFMPIKAFNALSQDFCINDPEDADEDLDSLLNPDADETLDGSKKSKANKLNGQKFHYLPEERDFLVNYMNCEKFHSCWDRFQEYSDIYEDLHKSWLNRLLFFL